MTLYVFFAGGALQQISETEESRAKRAATRGNGGISPEIWYGKIPVSASPLVKRLKNIGFKPRDRDHLLQAITEFS